MYETIRKLLWNGIMETWKKGDILLGARFSIKDARQFIKDLRFLIKQVEEHENATIGIIFAGRKVENGDVKIAGVKFPRYTGVGVVDILANSNIVKDLSIRDSFLVEEEPTVVVLDLSEFFGMFSNEDN